MVIIMDDTISHHGEPEDSRLLLSDRFDRATLCEMICNALFNTDSDSIYIKDTQGKFNLINKRVKMELEENGSKSVIGKTDKELFDRAFGEKTWKEEENLIATGIAIDGVIEVRGDAQMGLYWSSTTKIPLRDPLGNIVGIIGITRNINELKIREQKLEIMATHDSLTNVYNRYGLVGHLEEIIHQSEKMFAVMAIDLDNFKRINDLFLHKTGDEFLIWFSWLLKTNLRGNDIVARVGGDEFVVILNRINQTEDATGFCKKLYNNFTQSIEERFLEAGIGMSIGISFYPDGSKNPNQLLEQADIALYRAKENGKGKYQLYSAHE
jgi:diguanylate cyclase (GGDEF)-like protein